MIDFAPEPPGTQAFQNMFGKSAEFSPLGNAGASHFGFVNPCSVHAENPGWHVATQVGGLRQGVPIVIHDFLDGR